MNELRAINIFLSLREFGKNNLNLPNKYPLYGTRGPDLKVTWERESVKEGQKEIEKMKYMLVAGEASGDLHASRLMREIKNLDPEASFRFLGGDLMAKEAGRRPVLHYSKMNVMGFSQVLRKLPRLMRNLQIAEEVLKEFMPDRLLLIDYPSFNLRLAAKAHTLGIRTDYYIPPKVWAWKEWRVSTMKKYVSNVFCIFPFEVGFYARHGVKGIYVGNPSVEEIDHDLGHLPPLKHFTSRQGLQEGKPIIALLPGSRESEIRNNLPLMVEAARKYPEFQYVVAAAPSIGEKLYREVAQEQGLQLVFGATTALLKYSKAALVTSGTATLETALVGTPQVVLYRGNGSKLTHTIMSRVLSVRFVSLPNLILSNSIVPELLLHECTIPAICRELSPLLQPSPRRDWQLQGYKSLRRKLGTTAAARLAAEGIVEK